MSNWRRFVPIFLVVFIGLTNLNSVASKPRFQTFQTIDVVQLIATGMCFGAAVCLLVLFFRGARSSRTETNL